MFFDGNNDFMQGIKVSCYKCFYIHLRKNKLEYKINRINLLFMTFFLSALHISPFLLSCHKITCNNNAHPYSPSKYGNIEIIAFLCAAGFLVLLTPDHIFCIDFLLTRARLFS